MSADDWYTEIDAYSILNDFQTAKNTQNTKNMELENIHNSLFFKIKEYPETMNQLIGFIDIVDLSFVVPRNLHKLPNVLNKLSTEHYDIIYTACVLGNVVARSYAEEVAEKNILHKFSSKMVDSEFLKILKPDQKTNLKYAEYVLKIMLPKIASFFTLVISNYVMNGDIPDNIKIREITHKFISHINIVVNTPGEYYEEFLDKIGNFFDKKKMIEHIALYEEIVMDACKMYLDKYFNTIIAIDDAVRTVITDTDIICDKNNVDDSVNKLSHIFKQLNFDIDKIDVMSEPFDEFMRYKFYDSNYAHKFKFNPNNRHTFPLCDYTNFIHTEKSIYSVNKYLTEHLLYTKYTHYGSYSYYNTDYTEEKLKKMGYTVIASESMNWIKMICENLNVDYSDTMKKIIAILHNNRDDEGIHNKYDNTTLSTAFVLNMIANDMNYDYDEMISHLIATNNFNLKVPIIFQLQIFSRAANCDIIYFDNNFHQTNILNSLITDKKIILYNNMTKFYLIENKNDIKTNGRTDDQTDDQIVSLPDPGRNSHVSNEKKYFQDKNTTRLYIIS